MRKKPRVIFGLKISSRFVLCCLKLSANEEFAGNLLFKAVFFVKAPSHNVNYVIPHSSLHSPHNVNYVVFVAQVVKQSL